MSRGRSSRSKDYVPSDKELGYSIHNAAAKGREDTIDLLIRHGADPSDANMPMEFTPIMVAASKGHVHAMLLLIDRWLSHSQPLQYTRLAGLPRSAHIPCQDKGAIFGTAPTPCALQRLRATETFPPPILREAVCCVSRSVS